MTTLDLLHKDKSEIGYELVNFSDSQPHIKLNVGYITEEVQIRIRISSPHDLLLLLLTTEALRQEGVKSIRLFITYLLGARMDRRMVRGEPITLKVIAGLINQQGYDYVLIFDPHSDVSLSLMDRASAQEQSVFIAEVLKEIPEVVLVSPDARAAKKTEKLGATFNKQVVYCTKSRDPKTGYLSNVKVDDTDISGKDCLIVDDICDGGRTFLNLIAPLKAKGANDIYLAVSHGIFSQGLEPLSQFKKNIYNKQLLRKSKRTKLKRY